ARDGGEVDLQLAGQAAHAGSGVGAGRDGAVPRRRGERRGRRGRGGGRGGGRGRRGRGGGLGGGRGGRGRVRHLGRRRLLLLDVGRLLVLGGLGLGAVAAGQGEEEVALADLVAGGDGA